MRVLITEDNGELAGFIQEALTQEGYLSDIARSAGELRLSLNEVNYSAIILDLGLPDIDGLDVLTSLRQSQVTIPILILTARGGIQDRIKGLDRGADDYLTKPFSVDELLARIRALLRRPSALSSKTMDHANVSLDLIGKTVTVAETNVVMGRTELAVLEHFLRNVGLTVSKEALESHIYQNGYELTDNAMQVAIHRVRKKLKDNGALPTITTIRGIGYIFQ